ncbi:hypothetical protein RCL1_002971 [Eukaryota sp. TZLM3-RCL]
MIISSVMEPQRGRPLQIFTLVSDFTPGYTDIDSSLMGTLVTNTTDGVVLTDHQKSCLDYSLSQVSKMYFEQQQNYCRYLVTSTNSTDLVI